MRDTIRSDAYQITWLIRRLFRAMAQKSNESLEEMGITAADRAVLEFLYPDKRLSVPEIAARYQVSRQHIQVTVNSLMQLQLVSALSNPRHKRSSLLALTKRGRELFERILGNDAAMIDELFKGVTVSERTRTRRTLEKLYHQLNQGVSNET